jgi:hypothetical protein
MFGQASVLNGLLVPRAWRNITMLPAAVERFPVPYQTTSYIRTAGPPLDRPVYVIPRAVTSRTILYFQRRFEGTY